MAPKLLLVVEVVSLAMHLVLQGEVEGDVLHPLLGEGLGARLVLLLLDVLDHVGEPHRQAVVAAKGGQSSQNMRHESEIRVNVWQNKS